MTEDDLNILEFFDTIEAKFSYDKICELTKTQKEKYDNLLQYFKDTNNSKDASTNQKGEALEELVFYLIKISGNIFSIWKNIKTSTNELDLFVELNQTGKVLYSKNLLPNNLDNFICECKNYNKTVSVTYTGKFCSLLKTNAIKIGVLFSYKGLSGKNWENSCGLIKKFYLSKEKLEDRFCIIDFSIAEFEEISNGSNLLRIIDNKIKALRLDTDYRQFLSKHPLENEK